MNLWKRAGHFSSGQIKAHYHTAAPVQKYNLSLLTKNFNLVMITILSTNVVFRQNSFFYFFPRKEFVHLTSSAKGRQGLLWLS